MLQARNVLVGIDHRDIKVSGMDSLRDTFGSGEYVKISKAKDVQIHIQWLAPECLTDLIFSGKSDIWSFGVMLWEIMSYGKAPFGAFRATEIHAEIAAGRRLDRTDSCPVELFEEMARCWKKEPMARPTFAELQGAINLLLSLDGAVLRAKVEAAKHIAANNNTNAAWEVPMRGWSTIGAPVEAGSCGTFGDVANVWALHYKYNALGGSAGEVVSKEALAIGCNSPAGTEQLKRAMSILNDIRHNHVLKLIGCSSANGRFMLLFDRPLLGTLRQALADDAIPPAEHNHVLVGVALGLEYLHAINVVHGMLSSEYIYIQSNLWSAILLSTFRNFPHRFAPPPPPSVKTRCG
jgi:cadherin 2 type 1 (N-cadherin)